jgi:hypothetical protein
MIKLSLAREIGMKQMIHKKLITQTLQPNMKILMCVLAFGGMNKVN